LKRAGQHEADRDPGEATFAIRSVAARTVKIRNAVRIASARNAPRSEKPPGE
jgi:hypothetical protein